jgi:uncharacterized protein YdhG (YjbR/CyaY superfamily)
MNPVDDYYEKLPDERRNAMLKLREVINHNIPAEFEEMLNYGMPAWVVPKSLYPAGYHCNPQLPLPFLNIASQKSHIAFYHMGLYSKASMMEWFLNRCTEAGLKKPDMGKSCIRFKKAEDIPFELLGELCRKMSASDWISIYEATLKKQV